VSIPDSTRDRKDDSPHKERVGVGSPNRLDLTAAGVGIVLAGGFLEVAVHLFRRHVLHGFTFLSVDSVWMTPLCALLLTLPLLGGMALAREVVPRRVGWRLIVGVPTALATFSLLFLVLHNTVHVAAQALLAAGLGHAVGRLAARRPDRARTIVGRASVVIGATFVCVTAGVPLWQTIREGRAIGALAPLPPATPNVLLIILDTVRAASLGLYGYSRPTTPNLERWAARGVVFQRAYAAAPWTLPSHASIFTGQWPTDLSADWERSLDRRQRTLAEVLSDRGFATAGFTANLHYTGRESGLARGFLHYEDFLTRPRQVLLSSGTAQWIREYRSGWKTAHRISIRKYAGRVSAQFLNWIDRPRTAPFFAFLNYYDAHLPYSGSEDWRAKFRAGGGARDEYDAAIATLDVALDSLFGQLERRGVLDQTVVIVASDHGEMLGEHRMKEHGNSLYREELEVPLLMWGPGVPAGIRVTQPVSLRDLAATIAGLAGAADAGLPGQSLSGTWLGAQAGAQADSVSPAFARVTRPRNVEAGTPVANGTMVSIVEGTLHYIRDGAGTEQLFDLVTDSGEMRNLAASPGDSVSLRRLRSLTNRLIAGSR
jgi:arylsulfatase A-like enzyme